MGLYTGVLCIELERLSRGDGADRQRILKASQFSDTKVITLTETYDLAGDDSFDGEFFEFGLFMSRREYKMMKKRLYRGRIQAQKEGYFIGSRPPYGYGKNQTYIGKINTETVRCEKSIKDGKVVQRWLNSCEPVVVEGRHGPIADGESFWKCQEVRDSKKTRVKADQTLKNPLASTMFCEVCGKTIRRTHCDYKGERTFYNGCPPFSYVS